MSDSLEVQICLDSKGLSVALSQKLVARVIIVNKYLKLVRYALKFI